MALHYLQTSKCSFFLAAGLMKDTTMEATEIHMADMATHMVIAAPKWFVMTCQHIQF